jgi:hypothetical protein
MANAGDKDVKTSAFWTTHPVRSPRLEAGRSGKAHSVHCGSSSRKDRGVYPASASQQPGIEARQRTQGHRRDHGE